MEVLTKSTLPTSPSPSTPMVLSSSGGGSRINRARVTYGGRGRAGGLLHLKKPPTTSSLTSLPDESDDDDDSSSESSSSSEDDERKVGKMLVEKKEKVKATRTAAPWKKAGPVVVKKEPLRQHAANTANAAPTRPTPLKVSVPAPHPASSSSLSSAPSTSAASSASSSSRKASLAAQRKVQRILSFEEEEKKKADEQEKQSRRPSNPYSTSPDAAEEVAEKLEQQLRLSDDDDDASDSASGLASLLGACSQRQPLAFDDAFERILGGAVSSHLLRVEKAGDASYSKVYRLTKRVIREDIDWEESSILKVIPLRDGDKADAAEGTSETSSCADVEREIAITRALCSTAEEDGKRGRFVELRGAYVAEGPLAAVLSDIDDDNDDSGHASDHQQRKAGKRGRRAHASSPRSSSSPTLYALLDLDDCGVDLESYALPSSSSSVNRDAAMIACSIFAQVVDSLAIAEERFEFEHRDLHWGNVLVRDIKRSSSTATPPSSAAWTWPTLIDAHHTGVEATIIDFTLSRLTEHDGAKPRFYDLSVDESLFEGDGEVDEQFDVYRGMRDVVEQGEGGWQRFEPRTNVLWARYLVRKLLDGKGLRGGGERDSDGALEMLEATEAVLNESVAHFLKRSRSDKEEGCIESVVQLRDWMKEEMERRAEQKEREKEQEKEEARRPRARQQSQRPRKAAAATKEDGPTRRRSVRR